MATAKKTTVTEQRPVEVPVVQLTLTPDEAAALHKVTVNVGGSGKGRKDIDRVLTALDKVVDHYGSTSPGALRTEGSIHFRDKNTNAFDPLFSPGRVY